MQREVKSRRLTFGEEAAFVTKIKTQIFLLSLNDGINQLKVCLKIFISCFSEEKKWNVIWFFYCRKQWEKTHKVVRYLFFDNSTKTCFYTGMNVQTLWKLAWKISQPLNNFYEGLAIDVFNDDRLEFLTYLSLWSLRGQNSYSVSDFNFNYELSTFLPLFLSTTISDSLRFTNFCLGDEAFAKVDDDNIIQPSFLHLFMYA